MTLKPGTRLARYEIRSKIGEGGMGEVYRARDEQLNREVAIKVLPPIFSRDTDRLRRFEQEAQAAGALNHPNILAVYDVGTHDDAPYVVSELLEGESLKDRLDNGPISQRKAISYAVFCLKKKKIPRSPQTSKCNQSLTATRDFLSHVAHEIS